MLIFESTLVVLGSLVLLVGLYFAIRIVGVLQKEGRAQAWIVLTVIIALFLLGYVFIGLRFLGYQLLTDISNEIVVAWVFLAGAVFVTTLTFLNSRLFSEIFGEEISDVEAVQRFTNYFNLQDLMLHRLLRKHSFTCEVCKREIEYSVADVVRAHPQLDRGVVIEEALGRRAFTFYVRHRCGRDYRETPVQHDSDLEYRSQRPSRVV